MSTNDPASLELRRRYRGALLGLAAGDAIGTTLEFLAPGSFEPVQEMNGGGPFNLQAGAWTDDTSMALCLAESLVSRSGFDPVDQLERYLRWYREGYLSSTGECFDIGVSTQDALRRFEVEREPYSGDAFPDAGGNGPLMRLAPVAMAFRRDPVVAAARAAESARTTHGLPAAIDATRYLAALLVGALEGVDAGALFGAAAFEPTAGIWAAAPLCAEVAEVANGSFRVREPPEIQGRGFAPASLEAALWALSRSDSFESAVLAAVNLGDDADTTGAICGQLAGAVYGVDAIPERWRAKIVMRERIEELADRLLELSATVDSTLNHPGRTLYRDGS